MLQKIAKIVGLPFVEGPVMTMLERIRGKIAPDVTEFHPAFKAIVEKAEEEVNREGDMAMVALVKAITAPPPEKVLKIKSSPKGVRIKIAAANGVRFSFGPIWNASVIKGKGIATAEINRAKLNHQGLMAGVVDPEKMTIGALCAAIAATF